MKWSWSSRRSFPIRSTRLWIPRRFQPRPVPKWWSGCCCWWWWSLEASPRRCRCGGWRERTGRGWGCSCSSLSPGWIPSFERRERRRPTGRRKRWNKNLFSFYFIFYFLRSAWLMKNDTYFFLLHQKSRIPNLISDLVEQRYIFSNSFKDHKFNKAITLCNTFLLTFIYYPCLTWWYNEQR